MLAVSDQGFPLLIGQEAGTSRILAFAGDETWRWYTSGYMKSITPVLATDRALADSKGNR
ncbi:MAG: hypothetical protein U0936_01840 [Planctomycetaceae bacterium]